MKEVFDFEVWFRPHLQTWHTIVPIENPFIPGVFDYVEEMTMLSLNDVIDYARGYLNIMEQTHGVTFKMYIVRDGMENWYDIHNDHDMLIMKLTYS